MGTFPEIVGLNEFRSLS